jgi:CubicO group peptidase (beta-lactamase class C family)
MKAARRDVLGLGIAGLTLVVSPSVAAAGGNRGDALARIAAGLVRDGHAAGVQVGVAETGSEPLLAGFGMGDLETEAAVTPASVLRIASCTKQFTAAAILLLVEQGKLALDQPLDSLFPDFPRGD